MSDNLKIILEEFEKYKGQFVIIEWYKAERLVVIGDDDFDWYYITYDGKDLHWISCLVSIIPLKGYIEDNHYNELVRMAKLNHYDQIDYENFLQSFEEKIAEYPENHKFIAGPYWDIK